MYPVQSHFWGFRERVWKRDVFGTESPSLFVMRTSSSGLRLWPGLALSRPHFPSSPEVPSPRGVVRVA